MSVVRCYIAYKLIYFMNVHDQVVTSFFFSYKYDVIFLYEINFFLFSE